MEKRMANSKKISQAVLLVIFAFLFIFPAFQSLSLLQSGDDTIYYSLYDYEISAYDVDMYLTRNNILSVSETITVQHNEPMHGIVRAIPLLQTVTFKDLNGNAKSLAYKTQPLNVGGSPHLETYEEDGIFYFRFGQEDVFVNGSQEYRLNYTLELGDDRNTEFDQFYYNIIGNYWDTTISNITFKLTLADAVEAGKQMTVYTGAYGSTTQLTPITVNETGKEFVATFPITLDAGEGITTRLVLPEGFLQYQRSYFVEIVILILFAIITLTVILVGLKFTNKDQLVPVVNFTAPDDMPPSEMGYVIDGKVDNQDIAALIVFWAQKGYLIIENKEPEGKKEILYLKKIAEADDRMQPYEKNIFNKMFSSDDSVKLDDIGTKIFEQVARAKQDIAQKHEKKNFSLSFVNARNILAFLGAFCLALAATRVSGYATEIVKTFMGVLIGFGVLALNFALFAVKDNQYKIKTKGALVGMAIAFVALWTAFVLVTYHSYADALGLSFLAIIPSLIAVFSSFSINTRSTDGMKILGQILGFKQFIEFTEKDRIEMLVKENPQLFYNILPYAYVLGVSDKWIDKFENIAISPPSWYQTNNNVVDYLIFRSMFNSFVLSSTISMAYKPKMDNIRTSGIGGGFGGFGGGGGFSGGGFGGGGGRGW